MSELIVKFKTPYIFEEQEYNEVDLSGLENLTGEDQEAVEKQMTQLGMVAAAPALSNVYCKLLAAKATGEPIEFFNQMPLKKINAVTQKVSNFLMEDMGE